MIISLGITTVVAVVVAVLLNRAIPTDMQWFWRLRRPAWLTFEPAIPFIWVTIFICGIISATLVWEAQPPTPWVWMAGYLTVELAILLYMPVMCNLRNLRVGVIIGATGWALGSLLALQVISISMGATVLLLPYVLWSPIGTYVTWEMIKLNPTESR